MANKRITELTDIGTPDGLDVLEIVDVSDTTDSPEGTSKKVKVNELGGAGVQTVTGDLVNNTDPNNPIIETPTLQQVLEQSGISNIDSDESALDVIYSFEGDLTNLLINPSQGKIQSQNQDGSFVLLVANAESEDFYTKYNQPNNSSVSIVAETPSGGSDAILAFPNTNSQSGSVVISIIQTANFTAVNSARYTANGTLTVTDPTPVANKGFIVHVIGGTATIGGVGYTTGALVYRFYDGSGWISTNMNASGVAWGAITGTLSAQTDLQAALDARVKIYYENTTPSSAVTGTVAETQISGADFTIPANTINANGHFFVLPTILKTTATNTTQLRLKFNTTNNYGTATTIANFAIGTTNNYGGGHRKFYINGGNIKGFSFTTGVINDFIASASGTSSASFPVTGDLYFFWSIQNNASGDSAVLETVQITR